MKLDKMLKTITEIAIDMNELIGQDILCTANQERKKTVCMKFVLQFCTALVFLVFDSNKENEETLENQNPTNIATDMHELIKPSQYYACKTSILFHSGLNPA